MISSKFNFFNLKENNIRKLLFILLFVVASIPLIFNLFTYSLIDDYEIDLETYQITIPESSCLSRNLVYDLNENYFDSLEINEINKDIYVVPEFENIKCIGKAVNINVYENNLDIYVGTNPKFTNLIFFISIILFLISSVISKNQINLLINIVLFTTFLISYVLIYLPRNQFLFFIAIGYFFYGLLINFILNKNKLDTLNIAVTVLLPTFVLIQFNTQSIIERWYLYLIYISIFFLYKNQKENIGKNFFIANSIFLSFIINFGSFLTPLRDAEHWRQNQNAFAAKIMSQDNLSIFNPLPVFGINSRVPMEVPFMQIMSGLMQKVGIPESITLRPFSWLLFTLFLVLIYELAKNVVNKSFAEVVTIFIVFHPILYKFSNSYLGEFIPHIFGISSLLLLSKNKKWSALTLSMSLLSKVTSGVIYFLLWLYYLFLNKEYDKKEFITSLTLISIPNILWNFSADYIKTSNPLSAWLNSSNLRYWNFGTTEQYTDINVYRKIFGFMLDNFWGSNFIYFGVVFVALSIFFKKQLLLIFVAPFLFINLYYSHEYYFLAIIPIALFYILAFLYEKINNNNLFIFASLVLLLNINLGMNHIRTENLRIAYKINQVVDKEEALSTKLKEYDYQNTYLSSNIDDWSSIVFYESGKRGVMYQNRYEKLGNSKWNPDEIINQNIKLFVFLENNYVEDHLSIYLKHNIEIHKNLKLDLFEFTPKFGGFKDRKFFYAIFSPYKNEDQYDLLISENNTDENQYTVNCINDNDTLNESIKNNLIDLIDQNTLYSFKLNEDTIICK